MSEVFFPVKEENLWGFIDIKGNYIIKPSFINISSVFDNVFFAELPTFEVGLMTINGEWILPPQKLLNFNDFKEGFAIVHSFNLHGICNTKGVIKNLNPYILLFISEGLICAKYNDLYGFLDFDGNIVIDFKFDMASFFQNGYAQVSLPQKNGWSYINKKGDVVIKGPYQRAGNFSEGKLYVQIGSKFGYIDENENVVIKPIFDSAKNFSEELAAVSINGKYGFINHQNQIVIPFQYEIADNFINGKALVYDENLKIGYIDKQGKIVIPPQFEEAQNFSDGLAKVVFKKLMVSGLEENPFKLSEELMRSNPIAKSIGKQSSTKYLGIHDGYYYYMNESGEIIYPKNVKEKVEFSKEIKFNPIQVDFDSLDHKNDNKLQQVANSNRENAVKQLFAEFVQPFFKSNYLVANPYSWIGLFLGFLFSKWIIPTNTDTLYPTFLASPEGAMIGNLIFALLGFGIGTIFRNLAIEKGGFQKMFTLPNIIIAVLITLIGYKLHRLHFDILDYINFRSSITGIATFFLSGLCAAQILDFMLIEVSAKNVKKIVNASITYFIISLIILLLIVHAKGSTMHPFALLIILFFLSIVFTGITIFNSGVAESKNSSPFTFWPLFNNQSFTDSANNFFTFSIEEIQKYNYNSKFELNSKLKGFIVNRSALGLFAMFYLNMMIGLLPWIIYPLLFDLRVFD